MASADRSSVAVASPAKFWLLLTIVVGLLGLVVLGRASLDDVDAYLTLIVGYGVGNGINAVRGYTTSPVFAPADRRPPADDGA